MAKEVKKKFSKEEQQSFEVYAPMWVYGAKVGCKQEQLFNFTKAGLFLQAKQLEFCAAARACDEIGRAHV